jgi:hypothetical protein
LISYDDDNIGPDICVNKDEMPNKIDGDGNKNKKYKFHNNNDKYCRKTVVDQKKTDDKESIKDNDDSVISRHNYRLKLHNLII